MAANREEELRQDLEVKLAAVSSEQEERFTKQRAEALKKPYINLVAFPVDTEALTVVPKEMSQEARAVVFYRQGKDLRIGTVNPSATAVTEVIQHIRDRLNVVPQTYLISKRSLRSALARYPDIPAKDPAADDQLIVDQTASDQNTVGDLAGLGQKISQLSPTALLSAIAAAGVAAGASDIHVEPREQQVRLRFRIDGVLEDITEFDRSGYRLLLSRIKVLASLKLNVTSVPQDGSFVLTVANETYDVRVSTLPGKDGENIVMRLLNRSRRVKEISELGLKPRDRKVVEEALRLTTGMVLATGPTGSGKTTSLASFIDSVNDPQLKIITLEDPIEYRIDGIEQTQVDHSAGYDFAKGLRAILRQDPDIVMVGEIRDEETATTALHAALTGHLVFSTLHTNDAVSTIVRLRDLGANPNTIAPAINIVIAQRLVRVVCRECAEEYHPDKQVRQHIKEVMHGVQPQIFQPDSLRGHGLTLKKAVGCKACRGTGYRGRVGIFEIMKIHGEVEELLLAEANALRMQEAALRDGMTTIVQDGYLKVLDGTTTIEEVERVTTE